MKKNAILLVMFLSIITMIPGLSFAEADKVGLDDVIKILQVLSGGHQPPDFDASGIWAVKSVPEGITRTGDVYLNMTPDGKITGHAELKSLAGLSNVTGQVHGLHFDLVITSDYGSIIVHGVADSDGKKISGTFYPKDNVNEIITWDGYNTTAGTYAYDSQQNLLMLTFNVGNPLKFNVSEFTKTSVKLNGITWKRNNSGEVGDFVGIWRTDDGSIETNMTLDQNGNFSYVQKQIVQ